jgi:hypothetical protein
VFIRKHFGGLIVNRMTSVPGIRPRERAVVALSALYVLALIGLAVYFGHGDVGETKLGVVAIALPVACIGALLLMIEWRKLDGAQ